ncbi:Zinc finger protein CONSTANS-LIKE 4 [Hibiscus syriacus]|uniref:Zinc finger protein CONSTANS-LIKE 4 n=1 Tax=Hibiscus syriacus TaxID=106335 RepID=A0A6A3CC94_HIBSY|nr:zinc finger protein CONSTANS-LIKE 5-like isoform X1 [Hibiscus syriacus]XP_039057941.1 zinc finger protein CONSTANS-LIKE 5-like isoform X2 [Hibiscus syriacus]KAE8726287.1 Zinc finger protein CONSTANS-LIKE 4 [Hibiscus syriacus]
MGSVRGLTGGWGMATKICDICKSTAAAIFCRVDSAFMCLNCDSRVHSGTNKLGSAARHERVWMCEVCEQAPAAVTCKADAAALCVTCDADIHSANPLARRHERVPVEPFFDSADAIVKSSPFSFLVPTTTDHDCCQQDDVEAAGSWLLPNPNLNPKQAVETNEVKAGGDLFFCEMDPFFDFEYQNMFQVQHDHQNAAMDSVVPVQTKPVINNENCFEIEFCRSKPPTFSFQTPSLSHSVSSSSLDVGVVPDGNSMSDLSYSFGRTMTDSSGPMSATTTSSQAGGMDREARVLRYREKRKNRKFEKTIRYASRKAYAESRPRIKGRFAKRTQTDNDVDIIFNPASTAAGFISDTQYGLVPSF